MKFSSANVQSGFSPLFLKLLEKRGLTDSEKMHAFLFSNLGNLLDPFLMKGMTEAVDRLRLATKNQELILVHGDYDVDGVTGAAIISRLFQKMGARFEAFLPERERDGYGVSSRAIRDGAAKGVKILVTVDCGIAAAEQIKLARDLGLEVIILDHHKIPAAGTPNADIILNPLQADCAYPFKELSAAGIAFKLAQAILDEEAFELLDLAAISAIGDVVPLFSENRVIVKKGLEVIAAQKKPGVSALLAVSKVRGPQVFVTQVAFQLAPRINAAGRMGSPDTALRLLVTDSLKEAVSLAQILDSENEARKQIERCCTQEAIAWVERNVNFNREKIIVAASEKWHIGVIGIVAARLVEKFHRPAIVIGFQKGVGKGSGRSIPGFNLFLALQFSRETLIEAGGHAQAAGLSVAPGKVNDFRLKINQYAQENMETDALEVKQEADVQIGLNEITDSFLRELDLLEPHGAGNPHPKFLSQPLRVISSMKKTPLGSYEAVVSDGEGNRLMQFREEDYLKWISFGKEAAFEAVYEIRKKFRAGVESVALAAKQINLISDSAPLRKAIPL